jgi:hypothetical protein
MRAWNEVDAAPVEGLKLSDPQAGQRRGEVKRAVERMQVAGAGGVDERPDLVRREVANLGVRGRSGELDVGDGVAARPSPALVGREREQRAEHADVVAHAFVRQSRLAHPRHHELDVGLGDAIQGVVLQRRQEPLVQRRAVGAHRRRLLAGRLEVRQPRLGGRGERAGLLDGRRSVRFCHQVAQPRLGLRLRQPVRLMRAADQPDPALDLPTGRVAELGVVDARPIRARLRQQRAGTVGAAGRVAGAHEVILLVGRGRGVRSAAGPLR